MKYISVDVETAGLLPGHNSLLSVGAVDCDNLDNTFHFVISSTDRNDLVWDESTYNWWFDYAQNEARQRLYAFESVVHRTMPYQHVSMNAAESFYDWCIDFDDVLTFVGWPASFDYPFVQWLFKACDFTNPFHYRTMDIKSYICGVYGEEINCDRDQLPEWINDKPLYPHDALSDAIQQAKVFNKLRDVNQNLR